MVEQEDGIVVVNNESFADGSVSNNSIQHRTSSTTRRRPAVTTSFHNIVQQQSKSIQHERSMILNNSSIQNGGGYRSYINNNKASLIPVGTTSTSTNDDDDNDDGFGVGGGGAGNYTRSTSTPTYNIKSGGSSGGGDSFTSTTTATYASLSPRRTSNLRSSTGSVASSSGSGGGQQHNVRFSSHRNNNDNDNEPTIPSRTQQSQSHQSSTTTTTTNQCCSPHPTTARQPKFETAPITHGVTNTRVGTPPQSQTPLSQAKTAGRNKTNTVSSCNNNNNNNNNNKNNRKSINFVPGTAGGTCTDEDGNNNNNDNSSSSKFQQCCASFIHCLLMFVTLGMGQNCGGRTRMERNRRALLNMQHIYSSKTWQLLRIFGAFVLIFGPAIQILFNKNADVYFFILFTIILLLLIADMVICSCVHPTYFLWKWPCCTRRTNNTQRGKQRRTCNCCCQLNPNSIWVSRRYWCCNVNLWQRRQNNIPLSSTTTDHNNNKSTTGVQTSTYPEQQEGNTQQQTLHQQRRFQFGSFMFWLDLISTLSFLPEVFFPILNNRIIDVVTLNNSGVPIDHNGSVSYEVVYVDSMNLFYIIGRTARLARFIRPDMAVKLSSYFNWYSIKALSHDIIIWIIEGRWFHWLILKSLQLCDCCLLRGKCQRMWQREKAAIVIQRAYRKYYYQGLVGDSTIETDAAVPAYIGQPNRKAKRSKLIGGNGGQMISSVGLGLRSSSSRIERNSTTTMGNGVRSSLINISRLSSALTEKVDASNMSSLHQRHRRRISKYNKRSQVGAAMRELTAQRISLLIMVALIVSVAFLYQEFDITPTSVTIMLHSQTTDLFFLSDNEEFSSNSINNNDNNNNNNNSSSNSNNNTNNQTQTITIQEQEDTYISMALSSARIIQPTMYRYDFANGSYVTWNIPGYDVSNLRENEKLNITVISPPSDDTTTSTTTTNNNNNNNGEQQSQSEQQQQQQQSIITSAHFILREEAFFNAIQILVSEVFIVILWILGITGFAGPIMTLVVTPIERMIRLLEILTRDPLGYQTTPRFQKFVDEEYEIAKMTSWKTSVLSGMETSFLMSTILRIGSLMRVGFGSAGVEIIRNNLNSGTSRNSLAFDQTGSTVSCIFLFCDIRSFTDCTEALQEEVFVFTNRIAGVVHSICSAYGGSANKNIGDAFLLSWRLDEPRNSMAMESCRSLGSNHHNYNNNNNNNHNNFKFHHTDQREPSLGSLTDKLISKGFAADRALYSVIKVCQALVHDNYFLEQMSTQAKSRLLAKLKGREGPVVQIGFGLHAGDAVQGAIGSHRKIDATYLSETVDRSETLESLTKRYGVKVLMSGQFHELLTSSTRRKCRKVDQILVDEIDEEGLSGYDAVELGITLDLYTYDFDVDAKLQEKVELRKLTAPKRQMSKRFVSNKNMAAAVAAAASGWDDDCEDMVDERNFMARMKHKMGGTGRKLSGLSSHSLSLSGGRRRSSFESLDGAFARGRRINEDNILGGFHRDDSFTTNTVEPSLPTLPAQIPLTASTTGATTQGMEGNNHNGAIGTSAATGGEGSGGGDEPDIVLPNGPAPFNSSVWVSDEMRFMRERYTDGMFFNSFDSGLRSYFAGNWDDAKQFFSLILERMDDGPSKYFMKKMEETNWKPPKNFTGYGSP